MTKAAATSDEIYRAAIETAGHLGSPAERGAALRALAYELESRRLSVATLNDERGVAVEPGVLVVQGTDGVWVDTSEGREEVKTNASEEIHQEDDEEAGEEESREEDGEEESGEEGGFDP
ncbi:MAG: hypothetical protein HZB43_08730 [candidate division Zixibacteria bacterium]|nr:hypothetical protein [candidate division Zixibacteria bacterium]